MEYLSNVLEHLPSPTLRNVKDVEYQFVYMRSCAQVARSLGVAPDAPGDDLTDLVKSRVRPPVWKSTPEFVRGRGFVPPIGNLELQLLHVSLCSPTCAVRWKFVVLI